MSENVGPAGGLGRQRFTDVALGSVVDVMADITTDHSGLRLGVP